MKIILEFRRSQPDSPARVTLREAGDWTPLSPLLKQTKKPPPGWMKSTPQPPREKTPEELKTDSEKRIEQGLQLFVKKMVDTFVNPEWSEDDYGFDVKSNRTTIPDQFATEKVEKVVAEYAQEQAKSPEKLASLEEIAARRKFVTGWMFHLGAAMNKNPDYGRFRTGRTKFHWEADEGFTITQV